jgi:hypothetical protein
MKQGLMAAPKRHSSLLKLRQLPVQLNLMLLLSLFALATKADLVLEASYTKDKCEGAPDIMVSPN